MRELKIKMMDLSVGGVVWRFYAMMVGTLILGFSGQFFLATLWAYLLFGTMILGVSFKFEQEIEIKQIEYIEDIIIPLKKKKKELQEVE